MRFTLDGISRAFPDGDPGLAGDGDVFAGADAARAYAAQPPADGAFAAIELGTELLATHLGLDEDTTHRRTVGFARFRLGHATPSMLIEIVRLPWTDPAAVAAAQAAFEQAGFVVALCADQPGRIVDRLLRPYFNAVLRRLDDGLASAADMDTTLRLGLGYPQGPVALLDASGLAEHGDVSDALHRMTGDPDLAPARRARVAQLRRDA